MRCLIVTKPFLVIYLYQNKKALSFTFQLNERHSQTYRDDKGPNLECK